MPADGGKAESAFRTIGEVSREIGLPAHVLRYWETRFPQLRPLTRAGNRRYYRADDVALVRRIHDLLSTQGYTIRGVQKLLAEEKGARPAAKAGNCAAHFRVIRESLVRALEEDAG